MLFGVIMFGSAVSLGLVNSVVYVSLALCLSGFVGTWL